MSAPQLRRRLALLERLELEAVKGRVERPKTDRDLQLAARAVFDVLELHYPGESFVKEAAARLQAGQATDQDRAALAAMPGEALRIFGRSAEELLIMVGTLPAMTPELQDEIARHMREARAS